MGRYRFAAVAIASLWLLAPGGAVDAFEARGAPSATAAAVTDVSAQSRRQRRANLRIIVRPPRGGPTAFGFDVFPRAYPYDWPGPGFVRDCVGWLEPEWRLSGTVIVPRRRCAWVRG